MKKWVCKLILNKYIFIIQIKKELLKSGMLLTDPNKFWEV